jgi:predicted adenine nucleotide alpha hydrolase (AANH) superfamily ATPase
MNKDTKNIAMILVALAAAYGVIYVYQRYQRNKANERKATLSDAEKILRNL